MKYYFLLIIIFLIGLPIAHGNGFGIKFDEVVGDYIVNVDADTYVLTAEESVRFDFMLWNKDRTERLDFDNVWVNITPKGAFGPTFAGLLGRPQFGGFGMTYVFPKAGDYNMSVRLGKLGEMGVETIAQATFPLVVEKSDGGVFGQSRVRDFIISIILGLMIGAFSVFWFKRK
ncbi:hypothetical protein K8Q98_02685 [Candidatus Nomurabacteria bacterium]|nr:hypothetical protein [Candidatus Nomurabacteria bacterium]